MNHAICIHGHFYQPPRENPWLEEIETQESAAPFHDWNERITAECYDPNRAARLLDDQGRIAAVLDNYSRISFNFGPTLLSWLEEKNPAAYRGILEADAQSRQRFSGHGSAIAQAWGHIILPLANRRDRETQVLWGIRDFMHRFGREPEGMWLPEAAVDSDTLELLAANNIRFTILSPYQARRVRPLDRVEWSDVDGGRIDPKHPYLCRLPSGRSIAIFFYDAAVSRDVAFGGLLNSGDAFARRLTDGFTLSPHVQLSHIATDGESYGHHHRFGDMALARALTGIEAERSIRLTVYAEFLERHPPRDEVEIVEMSSWSCAHGVERWRSDCGCRIGSDYHQAWRAPLRQALDRLRDRLATLFEEHAGRLLRDPWQTRNDYIAVLCDRRQTDTFLAARALRTLTRDETVRARMLLEMQRHAMQMFTSCGWFFDEVSGIETVQILAYAARAIELAERACNVRLEDDFLQSLVAVPSNLAEVGNAARLYAASVRPLGTDLGRVAANYAIAYLFDRRERPGCRAFSIRLHAVDCRRNAGRSLCAGTLEVTSQITGESGLFDFSAYSAGPLQIAAQIEPRLDDDGFRLQQMLDAFSASAPEGDFDPGRWLTGRIYDFADLFRDERQRLVSGVIASQLDSILDNFRKIYRDGHDLLQFLHSVGLPIPASLATAAAQMHNEEIIRQLQNDRIDPNRVRLALEDARNFQLELDKSKIVHAATLRSRCLLAALLIDPADDELLDLAIETLSLFDAFPWPIDLWQAQNLYLAIEKKMDEQSSDKVPAATWPQRFCTLGSLLNIAVPNWPAAAD